MRFQQCEQAHRDHNLLRCNSCDLKLRGKCKAYHTGSLTGSGWSVQFQNLDMLRCKAWSLRASLTLRDCDHTVGKNTVRSGHGYLCVSKLAQWPIVYYTWFTTSTLADKSLFWHIPHTIRLLLQCLTVHKQQEHLLYCQETEIPVGWKSSRRPQSSEDIKRVTPKELVSSDLLSELPFNRRCFPSREPVSLMMWACPLPRHNRHKQRVPVGKRKRKYFFFSVFAW